MSYRIQFYYVRVGLSFQLVKNIWNLNSVVCFIEYFPQYHINYKFCKYAQVVETSLGCIKVG